MECEFLIRIKKVEPRGFEPLSKQRIEKLSTCVANNFSGYPEVQQI